MKTNFSLYLIIAILFLTTNCTKDRNEVGEAPDLPALETMALDFSTFTDNEKSGSVKSTAVVQPSINFGVAYLTVSVWNSLLFTNLVIPVVAYEYSFSSLPEYVGDNKWEWSYTLGGEYSSFSAILTGEKRTEDIKWEMRVSNAGTNAFSNFLWFEGTSKIDGSEGQWILYHSPAFPEKVVTIDWEASGDVINNVKYTYVREQDNDRNADSFNSSTLEYGVDDDADFYYFDIYYYNEQESKFVDVNIELNKSDHSGRIKSTNWPGGNTDWHCWDSNFQNTDCE
jgi:hypothetical protein